MQTPSFASSRRFLLVTAMLALGLGCALHKANQAYDDGRYDDAVVAYRHVLQSDPSNVKARIGIRRASTQAAEAHLALAREAEHRGLDSKVESEVRKALVLDPDNQIAQDWLIRIRDKAAKAKEEADAVDNLELMKARADAENPLQLNPRSLEGIDLNFSRRTSLREIFGTLSRATGVNIILHSSFQDASVSIDLRGLPFQKVLDTLMLQNDLFYKVIDRNTIMVFKATPQNREAYENQILKTYYLSNAEPDPIRSILTTLNPQLRVFTDKRINAIIVKAKPNELAIVDQVIRSLDKPKAEVMVYLELMEVTENSLEQVGLLPVINATDTTGVLPHRRHHREQHYGHEHQLRTHEHQAGRHPRAVPEPGPRCAEEQRRCPPGGQPQHPRALRRDGRDQHRREDLHHPEPALPAHHRHHGHHGQRLVPPRRRRARPRSPTRTWA